MDSVDAHASGERTPAPSSPLERELEPLLLKLRDSVDLSMQSQAKFLDLLDRFQRFLAAGHVMSLIDVTRVHVELFISAPSAEDPTAEPAVATMHLRRSAVRLLFRIAREAGRKVGDPTLDVRSDH